MNLWHTDTLTSFNIKLYDGLLRKENIISNEISKKYEEEDKYGYVLEKDNPETKLKERFFVRTEDIDKLPLVVDRSTKFSFRSEVFKMVNHATTKKIPSRPELTFKELLDFYANYTNSNPHHFMLSKLIMITGYLERLNIRIVSEASFGKDGLVDILSILNGNVANLYNATLAKLKYSLNNDFIVINELGGLNKQEIGSLQVYLTQAGSYKPKYENNSRSTMGTKEVMDLIDKSHIIFHNTPDYYQQKGQMYFEEMFTPAIMDRFPGLLMDGYVTEDFSASKSIEDYDEDRSKQLKKFIATLNHFKDNKITKRKFTVNDDFWGFKGKEKQRSLRSFKIISKYLAEYSETESEFIQWCSVLNKCRLDYKELIKRMSDYTDMFTKEEFVDTR